MNTSNPKFITITPGHKYILNNFEKTDEVPQTLQFIEKQPDPEDCTGHTMRTEHNGTTNEALLEVLIDRLNYLNKKFPSRENSIAIANIEQALMWLNKRTTDRVARNVEGKHIS